MAGLLARGSLSIATPSRFPSGTVGNGLAAYSCGRSPGIGPPEGRAPTVFPSPKNPWGTIDQPNISAAGRTGNDGAERPVLPLKDALPLPFSQPNRVILVA